VAGGKSTNILVPARAVDVPSDIAVDRGLRGKQVAVPSTALTIPRFCPDPRDKPVTPARRDGSGSACSAIGRRPRRSLAAMILPVLLLLGLAALLVVGYRLIASGTNRRVANGARLLVAAGTLVALLLGSLSFDAGL
jgi:hypothetical protein